MADKDKAPIALVKEPRIVVTVTAPIEEMLGELVKSGLYGVTPADAARRLIERGLEEAFGGNLTGGD